MIRKIKRYLAVMLVVCLFTCMAIAVPIFSNADSIEPTASIEISKVDKELLEKDEETAAINSDANISVDLLEKTLTTTNVVSLKTSNAVMSYLLKAANIDEYELFKPSRVDNSNSKYFPAIKDQGSLNSCTTWSTVYYQMSYAVNKALNRDAKFSKNVFSPAWVYTMANEGENSGNYYADILKILSEIGAVPMTKAPAMTEVDGDNVRNVKATKEMWLEASKYRVDEYYSIDLKRESETPVIESPKDTDLEAIKKALALGEVLTGTTYAYKWNRSKIKKDNRVRENASYEGQYIVTDCTGKIKGAHRITIVGYNDNIWVDINKNNQVEEGEKGAFKIANSYGDTYDNNGFIWISYDAVNAVSSLAKDGEAINPERDAAIFDVIGFNIAVNNVEDDCYAVLDVTTNDLKSLTVKVSVKDANGEETEYEPAPFTNGMLKGMGPYPFNSTSSGKNGVFYIDLSNIIEGITKDNVDDYVWNFQVASTSKENETVINSFKIFTNQNKTYTDSYIEQPIVLKNNMADITVAKRLTGYRSLARFFE